MRRGARLAASSRPRNISATRARSAGWTIRASTSSSAPGCWRSIRACRLSAASGSAAAIAIGSTALRVLLLLHLLDAARSTRAIAWSALENWNVKTNNEERRSLHDFVTWRDELRTRRGAQRVPHHRPQPDRAGGHHRARSDGRDHGVGLHAARASRRCSDVSSSTTTSSRARRRCVVIGHDVWQSRFASDPSIVGREVRLGNNAAHDRRRDAGRLRVSGEPQLLGAAADRSRGVRTRPGPGGVHLRPARARRDDERCAGGGARSSATGHPRSFPTPTPDSSRA